MAGTVDTLITKYVLDDGSYQAGAKRVASTTVKVGQEIDRVKAKAKSMGSDLAKGFDQFYTTMKAGFTAATMFIGAMAAVAGAILSASFMAAKKAADFDALVKSLEAVVGKGPAAKRALEDVFNIAKAPGLGREEALKGYLGMRRAGADDAFAQEIVKQFGNANATAGGGKDQLGRVLLAVQQMLSKEFLQGDEILQLTEGGIPAAKILKDIFGTSDPEKLKKAGIDSKTVVEAFTFALADLARVGDGPKNSLDNLADNVDMAMVKIGDGIIGGLFGTIDDLNKGLEDLIDAGVFKWFGEMIATDIGSALGMIETSDIRMTMIELGGVMIQAVGHTRNFFMQLQRILETSLLFQIVKKVSKVGGIDPDTQAEQWKAAARSQLEAFDRAKAKKDKDKVEEDAKRKQEMEKRRAEFEAKKKGFGVNPDASTDPGAGPDPVSEIAANTRHTAENTRRMLDLRETVFGGSALGRMGVTAREVKDIKSGSGGDRPEALVKQAVGLILQAFSESQKSMLKAMG